MAMRNKWWHFRFLFGQINFLSARQFQNCLTECQDKLSWIFDMSEDIVFSWRKRTSIEKVVQLKISFL